MKKIKTYLRFLFASKNQHGVHSPFVYDLITKCLYSKNARETFYEFNRIYGLFRKDKRLIEVTDLGEGSKVFKSNYRKVKKIAHYVAINKKYALFLNRLTSYLTVNSALELGTNIGLGTYAIAKNNPQIRIDTIEGCENTLSIAKAFFKKENLQSNIHTHLGNFDGVLPKLIQGKKYDLFYIDGNHNKRATLKYFKECLASIHNESFIIFDDIHWSLDMEEAWEEIKKNEQVTVTIDLFQWGLVFFRTEQRKQHFKIRF